MSRMLCARGCAIEPAPQLTEETSRLVRGVLNLQAAGRMVLVLDPDRAADPCRARIARQVQGRSPADRGVIKVLVVDDSALIRKLFGRVLSEDPAFSVGFARNGLEALAQLESFKPDVITLDVQMPQMGGLECLDRIMVQRPCPVVMISSLTTDGAEALLDRRCDSVPWISSPSLPAPSLAADAGICTHA